MRVVAGAWRGRRLQAPTGPGVRPTADRVREALFSILGAAVRDARVADLCCGSGALGIEALSRGAARADFVDRDPRSLRAARANLEALDAPAERWSLHRAPADRWLAARLAAAAEPLLILADPPYGDPVTGRIVDVAAAAPTRVRLLVLEHAPDAAPEVPAGWSADRRPYGRTELSILEPMP